MASLSERVRNSFLRDGSLLAGGGAGKLNDCDVTCSFSFHVFPSVVVEGSVNFFQSPAPSLGHHEHASKYHDKGARTKEEINTKGRPIEEDRSHQSNGEICKLLMSVVINLQDLVNLPNWNFAPSCMRSAVS